MAQAVGRSRVGIRFSDGEYMTLYQCSPEFVSRMVTRMYLGKLWRVNCRAGIVATELSVRRDLDA